MDYKRLSFLLSIFIHIGTGIFIFLNKVEVVKNKEKMIFVNLIEIKENPVVQYKKVDSKKDFKFKEEVNEDKIESVKKEINNEILKEEINEEKEMEKENKNILQYVEDKVLEKEIVLSGNSFGPNEVENSFDKGKNSLIEKGVDRGNLEVNLNKSLDTSYFKLVKKKIDEKIFYPEIARRRNIEGKVKIQFILNNDGNLREIKILKSSGNKILDDASIEIIKKSAPFPKFPENLDYKEISFSIDFNFYLK